MILSNFSSSNSRNKFNRVVSVLFDMSIPEQEPADEPKEKTPFKVTKAELEKISGDYWTDELETVYRFYLKGDKLFGFHNRFGEFELEPIALNQFNPKGIGISKIEIVMDKKGKVTGMYMTNSRVRNLKLTKLNTRL